MELNIERSGCPNCQGDLYMSYKRVLVKCCKCSMIFTRTSLNEWRTRNAHNHSHDTGREGPAPSGQ